jgi:hypothetical protein
VLLLLATLTVATSLNGAAALDHASKLAALGPHPLGSVRAPVAAAFVAACFRDAGLEGVRLQEFGDGAFKGTNVIGILPAQGPEFLVVGAHHDTTPDSPGAYDGGGGLGVIVEMARVLGERKARTRSVVFVSWDGSESQDATSRAAGVRAYVRSFGPERAHLVAALILEMAGWRDGVLTVQSHLRAEGVIPGGLALAPAWLAKTVLRGAVLGGDRPVFGERFLPWAYAPAARIFRFSDLHGDDLPFLEAGLPAVVLADSSPMSPNPVLHRPGDVASELDAEALSRLGRAALEIVQSLESTSPVAPDVDWYAIGERVLERNALLALGLAALVLGVAVAFLLGGVGIRLVACALVGVLLLRHPLPALFVFSLPLLVAGRGALLSLLSLLPAVLVLGYGALAWQKGLLTGLWVSPLEIVAGIVAFGLLFLRMPKAAKAGRRIRRTR